jgi:predicted DNA-binding transcriptional regulator AlpA
VSGKILRMRDLKERRIIPSWPALKRKIERDGFPPGFLLGPNSRAWLEDEVDAWIASRPSAAGAITPRGIALKKLHEARAAKRRDDAEATEKNLG